MEQRLQKVLAAAGVGSRRRCEELIAEGRVAVDGKTITELGVKVDPEKSKITVGGRPVELSPEKVYILLNKPRGYTSTRFDPHAKHTVLELLKDVPVPVYPVGRLDVDSEGLLILSNDGDFTYRVTHPSHELPKTYIAKVRGRVLAEDLRALEQGIELEDGKTSPAKARVMEYDRRTAVNTVELTIHEGRKRQVRRMFKALDHPVQSLIRTRIGSVTLVGLDPGQWRRLTESEVRGLMETVQNPARPVAQRASRTPSSPKRKWTKPKPRTPDSRGGGSGERRSGK